MKKGTPLCTAGILAGLIQDRLQKNTVCRNGLIFLCQGGFVQKARLLLGAFILPEGTIILAGAKESAPTGPFLQTFPDNGIPSSGIGCSGL